MNNIGAFISILSEFSTGYTGKEKHLLRHADDSQCLYCIGDSMTNKPFSIVTSPIPSANQVNVQGVRV